MTIDKIQGALLGLAVGDALGMPVEGFSHQNVRTYYKGIKGYRDDEKRGDLRAGQWTDDTQLTFGPVQALCSAPTMAEALPAIAGAYVCLLPKARRWGPTTRAAVERLAAGTPWEESGEAGAPTNGAVPRVVLLGVWWAVSGASDEEAIRVIRPFLEVTHRHLVSVAAGLGQAYAVVYALRHNPGTFQSKAFWKLLTTFVQRAEAALGSEAVLSSRLLLLGDHLTDFPLDLQDLCNGTGVAADESWPFAMAMFARNPNLIEATLLSTINVGGDADTTGAMVGSLLGTLHGWSAFPQTWRQGLEATERLQEEARVFAEHALIVFKK